MRIEEQAPIIGSAFVGGMAQSYLLKRYPEWSWMLSGALVVGGAFLATKSGWMESIGLGVASAGASGLGTGLMPVGTTTTARRVSTPVARAIGGRAQIGAPTGQRYPSSARTPEFQNVRLS
jgi:hypothetical protein